MRSCAGERCRERGRKRRGRHLRDGGLPVPERLQPGRGHKKASRPVRVERPKKSR
ncbi:hypothetical protein DWUX_1140 [Desulfovibrio diazotrophicus]|nr:hypothetical protein DWUX_1140 [Desulfovibrio diazotrophicus]